jgi:GAF domain-containing protein
MNRLQVRPYTDKQIALVETFADQAAIAIENVRLLDELRQSTNELGRSVGELRALGEVSQAVNSTLELETVLSTIVAKAVQLSGTEAGAIYVFDELQRALRLRATYGMDQELIDALTQQTIGMNEPYVAAGKDVQSLLHDKARWRGHWPWPVHHSRHRREATFGVYRGRYATRRIHRNQDYSSAQSSVYGLTMTIIGACRRPFVLLVQNGCG